MGLGGEAWELYKDLVADVAFAKGNSVCELGSQDIQWGGDYYWHAAREYYEKELGLSYVCIDIDGQHGALSLDLNTATLFDVINNYEERFDVVTNHGTTEHCFNQYNCFKLMHDLTKVTGLMVHIVPSHPWGRSDDSFYYYSPGLFIDLAEANEYTQVRCETIDGHHGKMVLAVFRKDIDTPFRAPIQKLYQRTPNVTMVPDSAELGVSP